MTAAAQHAGQQFPFIQFRRWGESQAAFSQDSCYPDAAFLRISRVGHQLSFRTPPFVLYVAKHGAWSAFAVTAGAFLLAASGNPEGLAPVPAAARFGVAGIPQLGLAGGLVWGLALMRRDRWHGIVGVTEGLSPSPRGGDGGAGPGKRRRR